MTKLLKAAFVVAGLALAACVSPVDREYCNGGRCHSPREII